MLCNSVLFLLVFWGMDSGVCFANFFLQVACKNYCLGRWRCFADLVALCYMKPGICQKSVLHHMKPQWMTRAENWESFRLVKDSPQKNRGREVRPNFFWPIGKLCHSVFVQFRVQWFRSSLMGVRIEDLLHNPGKMVFLFVFQSLRIQLWIMIMEDYDNWYHHDYRLESTTGFSLLGPIPSQARSPSKLGGLVTMFGELFEGNSDQVWPYGSQYGCFRK